MTEFKICPYCGSKDFIEKELKDDMSWITKYSTEATCNICKKMWYSNLLC